MAAGQQVALEPALADVLGEHLHHPPVRREVLVDRRGSPPARPCRSPRRPRRAGSRRSRPGPKRRKSCRVVAHDVAQARARAPGWPRAIVAAGLRHVDGVVAEVGQPQVVQQQRRRWRAGWRSSAARPPARARRSRTRHAVVVEQLLGPVAAQPRLELREVLGVRARVSASGTWCARQVPSTGTPSTSSGRSSPWACAARSSASAGARRRRPRGARPAGCRAMSSSAASSAAAMLLVHVVGVVALDEIRARGRSRAAARASSSSRDAGEHASGWRSCSR